MAEFAKNVSGLANEKDSVRAFREGARLCASAARELAKMTQDPAWKDVAITVEAMQDGVYKMSRMKSLTRIEQLQAVNIKSKFMGVD